MIFLLRQDILRSVHLYRRIHHLSEGDRVGLAAAVPGAIRVAAPDSTGGNAEPAQPLDPQICVVVCVSDAEAPELAPKLIPPPVTGPFALLPVK